MVALSRVLVAVTAALALGYPAASALPDGAFSQENEDAVEERHLVVAPCQTGWTYYSDSSHSEGKRSCIKFFNAFTPVSNAFAEANARCSDTTNSGLPHGHLLTFKNSEICGLPLLASQLFDTDIGSAIIGCKQDVTATKIGKGWRWIDGTSRSNINCNDNGRVGCKAWADNEPNDGNPVSVVTNVDQGAENYCQLYSAGWAPRGFPQWQGLNDFKNQFTGDPPASLPGGYICEVELPGSGHEHRALRAREASDFSE